MADIQGEIGGAALRNIIVFLSWTLTSFLCHFCAKAFLSSIKLEIQAEKDPDAGALQFRLNVWSASLVTFVQMSKVYCYMYYNLSIYLLSSSLVMCKNLDSTYVS
ncbi:hypothetical protein ElyMa_005228300 [Elysia marginata]|uniref:Uncharacterized protein n=1 Tax=Elysia marginata TaxID=1093978 RepID=A0AAV4JVR6_9GAST|nr:hypothetical protein ElyMa_005228300 [Elysia marginata]